ncbi:MAG TPA: helical backbone metal receptor [Candidatus Hydrogenedentes bacterium]|nr:helical backbone metal receptor [Candidatus Hydrogenedentota bacterium]HPJ99387.1 helical backbone metal receptor [Candidatus Hydrogenedentota bacterium]
MKRIRQQRRPDARIASVLCAVAIGLCGLCGACGGQGQIPVQNGRGEEVHRMPPPEAVSGHERIITFAPHITETVFALGKGALVVAVSDFCDFPPEIEGLERVGGWHNPNLEKITRLNPDLIIVQGEHERVTQLAAKRGFELLRVNMDSLATIREGIRLIGDRLGCPEEAKALVRGFDADLASIRECVAAHPRMTVLILTGRQLHDMTDFHTVGGTSFVSELVATAGGDNLYQGETQPYLEASKETAVMRAPEAIIEFHAGETFSDDIKAQYLTDWQQMPSLPAVRNHRIYLITESHALRPGPRVSEIAARLAALLYPDLEGVLRGHGQMP